MKTGAIIFILFGLLFSSCSSQNIRASKVPSVVVNAAKNVFPNATETEWKKIENLYEADIEIGGAEAAVLFTEQGALVMQKQDILLSELPPVVLTAIQTEHSGYSVKEAEEIKKDGVVYYQLELEGKNKKDLEIVVTKEGGKATGITYWD